MTALCVLPLMLTACSQDASPDPRTAPPLVRTATVMLAEPDSRTFTGTVSARVESDLGFRVAGKVLERLVEVGETVDKGQPLMRLDPVDLTLAAHSEEQSVAAARARAKQTAEDERRYRDLRGTGAISESRYDEVKAAADAAQAQLRAAEAQAEVARNATQYSTLVADADGVVMDTLAEPGQVVSAGQTVVRLAYAGPREAVIQLPETLRPSLGTMAQAMLYGHDDIRGPASLRQLSEAADPLTRTFEARYVLGAAFANAPLGATVSVRLPTRQKVESGSYRIPIRALYDNGSSPGVWVVEGEPAKVRWQPIDALSVSHESARVKGELEEGTRVVAMGAHLLREGDTVRLDDADAGTQGGARQ